MKPLLALLALLALAPAANAATWSPPARFDAAGGRDAEPVPRAAITAAGAGLVAWADGRERLVASVGDARGRFGASVVIARRPNDWSVAAGAIAYEASDGIHVAVRSGRRFHVRRVAASTGSEINGVEIAADPLGGWVVAERSFPRHGSGKPYRVRALSLDAHGRPAGPVQDLGLGEFGIDARPSQALTVTPDGRAVLTFVREPESIDSAAPTPVVVATRPHGGAFGTPVPLASASYDEPRVTAAAGRVMIGAERVTACGDAGCAGLPQAAFVTPDGALGVPAGPPLTHPNRAFGPWAVPTAAGAGVLVFQLKQQSEAFSREAPVRAATVGADGRVGALQTLTAERASEPVALPLDGGRVLAVWSTRHRLGAALAGGDGRFHAASAPAGPPPDVFHSNATDRDIRAAGRFAIVAWSRGTVVRISVRRF